MKSISSLLCLLFLFSPLNGFTQTYGDEELDPELEEQLMAEEEFLAAQEADAPGEIERQDEVLHPEGEENDWRLGSEEIPAEEYE